MSRTFNDLRNVLTDAGWRLVRTRTHHVYRCPCGQHQTSLSYSPSDRRGVRNKRSELRKMQCPSLEGKV